MKRIKRIFDVFGIYYGIKYAIAYQLHRCCYIKRLAKRVVRLKYKGTNLYVRLFSRDLDFLESIYIGRYSQGAGRVNMIWGVKRTAWLIWIWEQI